MNRTGLKSGGQLSPLFIEKDPQMKKKGGDPFPPKELY
jgi:hypothetical protein